MNNCFICDKSFEKGIGICCSRQCHNKRINKRSRENDKQVLEKIQRIEIYNANPTLCQQCQKPLTYDLQHNKFCSTSCSASFNNIRRDPDIYRRQSISIRNTYSNKSSSLKSRRHMLRVCFRICWNCQQPFRAKRGKKYCSDVCKITTDIKVYRRACKFKISKKLHPNLFDVELLEKHGWYRASNHTMGYNPNGATWDHLFRVEDGFKLKVSPEIMRHPANAQMVSWKENFSRKQPTITYEELLARIKSLK